MMKQEVDKGKPEDQTAGIGDMSHMVCGCLEFTRGDMAAVLSSEPGMGFDTFLEKTGTGQTCTACLLDLECEFIDIGKATSSGPSLARKKKKTAGDDLSLKRRIYNIVDGISPMAPATLWEVLPVLSGGGFKQSIVIANHSLLYEGKISAPPVVITLDLRDGSGRLVERRKRTVEAGSTLRENVSEALGADSKAPSNAPDPFKVGSVYIQRHAAAEGYLGTTRPQTELLGPGGCTSVHGNAARVNGGGEIIFDARGGTRRFISFVSTDSKPIEISLYYPQPLYADQAQGEPRDTVVVPPNGTVLAEIEPDAVTRTPTGNADLCRLIWRGMGCYRTHAFNSDSGLGRMSIDHV